MLRVIIKVLHEIGAVGVLGSFAASLLLVATAPRDSLAAYAVARQGIAAIAHWLLVPSLAAAGHPAPAQQSGAAHRVGQPVAAAGTVAGQQRAGRVAAAIAARPAALRAS